MDAVTALGAAGAQPTTTDRGTASLTSEDFFQLLVTELQQQDPFEPTKTSDMVGQVADIRGIELSSELTEALSNMTANQYTTGTADLLGKHVTALVPTGSEDGEPYQEVQGIVTGVSYTSDGQAVLELDTGQRILTSHIVHITDPELVELTASADESGEEDAAESASAAEGGATAKGSNAKSLTGGLLPWLDALLAPGK
jgi:flagellar hook assembly protein FlgD